MFSPGVLLTLVRLRVKRVPEPESGVKSFEKAETRKVLIVPAPKTLAVTFQLVPVSPLAVTGGLWKAITDESKVKSPWKPIKLSPELIVVVTMG